jgi:hypothetical protein
LLHILGLQVNGPRLFSLVRVPNRHPRGRVNTRPVSSTQTRGTKPGPAPAGSETHGFRSIPARLPSLGGWRLGSRCFFLSYLLFLSRLNSGLVFRRRLRWSLRSVRSYAFVLGLWLCLVLIRSDRARLHPLTPIELAADLPHPTPRQRRERPLPPALASPSLPSPSSHSEAVAASSVTQTSTRRA